jgi:predicted TIM-barrel fold metal-dependent hydrolase
VDREALKGRVFDADNHFYETRDALTKFVPDAYKTAVQYVEVNGRTKIATSGHITDYIPNPTFEYVAAPGAQEAYFRGGNKEGKSYRELVGKPIKGWPAFFAPEPRLELMDELGIDRSMMYPTLASLVEERFRDEPDVIHVLIHALNEWIHETWSFDYAGGRIITTPVITLPFVDRAIEELEWVLERGAKSILIRPAPVPGFKGPRSFALPEFDPFWARVVEAGIPVVMHGSDTGYARQAEIWDNAGEFKPFQQTLYRYYWAFAHVAMADAIASMVCHGLFHRFPDLKVLSVENGSNWMRHLFDVMDELHHKQPAQFPEHPHETIRRNVWLHPFWEGDLVGLSTILPVEHILFGSDFPHPEGLADPLSYVDELTGRFSDDDVLKIMGGNMTALVG